MHEIEKDFKLAYELYQKSARAGNYYAIFQIGQLYEEGSKDFERDVPKALEIYQKSVELGNEYAMIRFAWFYQTGKYVPKDLRKSIELYKKAIEKGSDYAMHSLAEIYSDTQWVFPPGLTFPTHSIFPQKEVYAKKDYEKAIHYYKCAIERGNDDSMNALGILYHEGVAVRQDLSKAVYYYTMAAEKGNDYAARNLAAMYEVGEGVKKNINKAAQLYLDSSFTEKSKKKLCELVKKHPHVQWSTVMHKYWPKLETNSFFYNDSLSHFSHIRRNPLFQRIKLQHQIFTLLLVSKCRAKAKFAPTNFIVHGVALVIIKNLSEMWRNDFLAK